MKEAGKNFNRRKQELFLDAIEHSFTMSRVAYERVVRYCRDDISEYHDPVREQTMVLDAWSFIDVVRRLRTLLATTPGLGNTESRVKFLASTSHIPDFRHHFQHIDEKVREIAFTGLPIWGSFSWARLTLDRKGAEIFVYVPGRLAKTSGIPMVNPAGREFHDEVDHIEVTIGGKTLKLSEIYLSVESLQKQFERALKTASTKSIGTNDSILLINLGAD